MRRIPLTRGRFACVSNCDYAYLKQWNWYCGANGYAMRDSYVTGRRLVVYMHRLICHRANRPLPNQCDHRDGRKRNNQRRNLRPATKQQNMQNRGPTRRSVSGHKGVYWSESSQKWYAKIKVNQHNIHLGYFVSLIIAVRVRHAAERQYFGHFAHPTARAA
jgi:hypothetical protein